MRLATVSTYRGERLAIAIGDQVADLSALRAANLEATTGLKRPTAVDRAATDMPSDLNAFLRAGADTWERAKLLAEWASEIVSEDPERIASCLWPAADAPLTGAAPYPPQ